MRNIPECLSRRYKALDDLIQELNSYQPDTSGVACTSTDDPGIKLMCDFWGILKEDPDINLTEAVQQRMKAKGVCSGVFGPSHVSCYLADCCRNEDKKREAVNKIRQITEENQGTVTKGEPTDSVPLTKVLCNLKDAATFEQKCHGKINDLLQAQKQLQDQIQILEQREKAGVQLLKEAECMWSCMEEAYKKKIAESLQRQQGLLKQLKEVEQNHIKWKKNKKDLDLQMSKVANCHQEIEEKINEKSSDLTCIKLEIENFKTRIEANKKDLANATKSLGTKKQASEAKIAKISAEVTKLEKKLEEEQMHKQSKEKQGTMFIKEARDELQKLCKILLQKKLENEDMMAEKEALLLEIDLLLRTCDECKDKCKNKQESMIEEIKKLDNEIANFNIKCIRCHECTDTTDIKKFCTDCPRCQEERNCLYEGEHCTHDQESDCVCMSVKMKFLDNVFDNMYTILERQIKSGAGKAVAEEVLKCLKKSKNGKLNEETRKILQEFILTTVKRNLNLTIVGGAVKTRCELDPKTYEQLMLCLKQVKVTQPKKTDKGTDSKKEPCRRWGGSSECNCPRGPKSCICTKKAPQPPSAPSSCPPEPPDKEDEDEQFICPHKKESTPCGVDCGMRAVSSSAVGTEVSSWRPSPCEGPTCQFKNMRAAQCVLGPEGLSSFSSPTKLNTTISYPPTMSKYDDQGTCRCGALPSVSCVCKKDSKQMKATIPKPCDKETCTIIWKSSEDKNINKDGINTTVDDISVLKRPKNSSVTSQNKGRLKVTLRSAENKLNDTSIVSNTSSGDLKMALDKKIISAIEKKMQDNPNLYLELNKTSSGKLSVDLHTSDILSNTNKNVLASKSPSGHIILEVNRKVNKNSILEKSTNKQNTIQSTTVNKTDGLRTYSDTKDNNMIHAKKQPAGSKSSSAHTHLETKENALSNCEFLSQFEDTTNKLNAHKSNVELKKTFPNEVLENLCTDDTASHYNRKASVTRASSVHNMFKTNKNSSEKSTNEVNTLRTTKKGNISGLCGENCKPYNFSQESLTKFLLETTSDLKNYSKRKNKYKTIKAINRLFQVKVRGINNTANDISFAIKATHPGVYELVLDKEFEQWHRKVIMEHKGDDDGQYVQFSQSDSGQFVVNFDNNASEKNSENALLMKSESGTINIVVSKNNSETDIITKRFESVISPHTIKRLMNTPPYSSIEYRKEHFKRSQFISTKSSSDSNLYEKVKLNLQNNQNLIDSEPVLKKTKSGQYTIVLHKESKKAFINNLKSYISTSPKGLIPIKRTDSGNITVNFSNNPTNHYGSLKITSSGNMYVVLDTNTIKELSSNIRKIDKSIDKESKPQYVKKNKTQCYKKSLTIYKSSTTFCNSQCKEISCNVSKCVCDIERYKSEEWFLEHSENSSKAKRCGPNTVVNDLKSKGTIEINNEKHIVIRSCGCRPVLRKSSIEDCYYNVQSTCPYHIDRDQSVSNEISEISGLFKSPLNENEKEIENKAPMKNIHTDDNWDSIKYLPPQLPPFLINYKNL